MSPQLILRILSETRLALAEIPGRNGVPTNPITVWRGVRKGLKAPDGKRASLKRLKFAALG